MEFDLNEDQQTIQRTARSLLSERATAERLRAAANSGESDEQLWRDLVELGWPGIAVAEADGGEGLGMVELCVLLEAHGAALAPTPFLEAACAARVISRAGSALERQRWLPELLAGRATPGIGMGDTPGQKSLVAGSAKSDCLILLNTTGALLASDGIAAGVRPLATIDPLRSYCWAEIEGVALPDDAGQAFAEASVAVAAELTGVSQRALDITVAYVKERQQFGAPVGSFQAVAHTCAEMLLATESARSTTYYAAWAADAAPELLPEAAALAKTTSSEAALQVTASAIQMHGGIGFSWEADVHWYYKRAQLSAQLFGGAKFHRDRLGEIILRSVSSFQEPADV